MPTTRPRTAPSAEPDVEVPRPVPTAACDRDAGDAEPAPPSRMRQDLLAWLVRIDDLLVDARTLPRDFQEMLAADGLIPYVPGAPGDDA